MSASGPHPGVNMVSSGVQGSLIAFRPMWLDFLLRTGRAKFPDGVDFWSSESIPVSRSKASSDIGFG